jgi:hypothetical protein
MDTQRGSLSKHSACEQQRIVCQSPSLAASMPSIAKVYGLLVHVALVALIVTVEQQRRLLLACHADMKSCRELQRSDTLTSSAASKVMREPVKESHVATDRHDEPTEGSSVESPAAKHPMPDTVISWPAAENRYFPYRVEDVTEWDQYDSVSLFMSSKTTPATRISGAARHEVRCDVSLLR